MSTNARAALIWQSRLTCAPAQPPRRGGGVQCGWAAHPDVRHVLAAHQILGGFQGLQRRRRLSLLAQEAGGSAAAGAGQPRI